jgi:hypothetical protein
MLLYSGDTREYSAWCLLRHLCTGLSAEILPRKTDTVLFRPHYSPPCLIFCGVALLLKPFKATFATVALIRFVALNISHPHFIGTHYSYRHFFYAHVFH